MAKLSRGPNRRALARAMALLVAYALGLAAASYEYRRASRAALEDGAVRVAPDVQTVIVGDSRPATSLDPSLLRGSTSFARQAEPFFFTCQKLRFLLDRNRGIRRVILGYSSHSLSRRYQESYLFDDFWQENFEQYFGLLDTDGKMAIRSLRTGYVVAALKTDFGVPIRFYQNRAAIKWLLGRPLDRSDYSWTGGYESIEVSQLNDRRIAEKVRKYFLDDKGQYAGVSDLTVRSLRRTLELCRARRVQVCLYEGPTHTRFRAIVPSGAVNAYREIATTIRRDFPETEWALFGEYPLADEAFYDGDHTNRFGARVITTERAWRLGLPLLQLTSPVVDHRRPSSSMGR
jgi:hypothetical protein